MIIQSGNSNNTATVNADNELLVAQPTDVNKAGYSILSGETTDGSGNVTKLIRPSEVSMDYKLRVGLESVVFFDKFGSTGSNTGHYRQITSTQTLGWNIGYVRLNNSAITTAGTSSGLTTWQAFPVSGPNVVYADFWIRSNQTPLTNSILTGGVGFENTTAPFAVTDGVYFRIENGQLNAGISYSGSTSEVTNITTFSANTVYHITLGINPDKVEVFVDDILQATIDRPTNNPYIATNWGRLFIQHGNGSTPPASAVTYNLCAWGVSQADQAINKPASHIAAGIDYCLINPLGQTTNPGQQSANWGNSAAPAAATLSNTAAGYTTLGGLFLFNAPAGANTDYALFGYQINGAAASITQSNKKFNITNIRIDSVNIGAAVATTATVMYWGLGVGSTAVSLATTDNVSTTPTRAPRRTALGVQSWLVGDATGKPAEAININFDTPVVADPGTFLHIILRVPVGTATASQQITGTVTILGYYD